MKARPAAKRVRHAVLENRLVSGAISDRQVRQAIEPTSRGWVIEERLTLIGFAIGNAGTDNIWALHVLDRPGEPVAAQAGFQRDRRPA